MIGVIDQFDDLKFKTVGVITLVVVAGRVLSQQLLVWEVDFQFIPGIVVALGLLLGPITAWGAALGVVITHLFSGSLTMLTFVDYIAQFVLVISAYRLWGTFGTISSESRPGIPNVRNLVEFLFVAMTSIIFTNVVMAWLLRLFGEMPFPVALMNLIPASLLSVLFVGPVTFYGTAIVVDSLPVEQTSSGGGHFPIGLYVLGVSLIWGSVGFAVGMVFQALEMEVTHQLANQVGRIAFTVLAIAGPGGIYIQAIGGLIALGTIGWVFQRY